MYSFILWVWCSFYHLPLDAGWCFFFHTLMGFQYVGRSNSGESECWDFAGCGDQEHAPFETESLSSTPSSGFVVPTTISAVLSVETTRGEGATAARTTRTTRNELVEKRIPIEWGSENGGITEYAKKWLYRWRDIKTNANTGTWMCHCKWTWSSSYFLLIHRNFWKYLQGHNPPHFWNSGQEEKVEFEKKKECDSFADVLEWSMITMLGVTQWM